VELEVVGGPSALCLSLSLSPIPYTPFIFVGFLDKKKKFIDYFKKVSTIVKSVVFFESCHRVRKTISLLKSVFSTNFFLILHELTKINQKIIFKKLNEVIEEDIIERGEYTFILYF
jgi:16S rRNA (cytidine1402-2'-O)-methyltransferase